MVEILKTPIAEVTADHRLAQFYDAKSGKIELPNKLGAMQLLPKCADGRPRSATRSRINKRHSRSSSKSSHGCAG